MTVDYQDLLDPAELSKVGHLELLSRRVVDGYLSGKHRSRSKGGCVEFDEHRAYTPGDELRLIDWRLLARTDRAHIKQFEEDVALQTTLVLDASGSMGFAGDSLSKFNFARVTAACLARIILRQGDSAGLMIAGNGTDQFTPARGSANHLRVLLTRLAEARYEGETSLPETLNTLSRRTRQRGLVIILSDCFDDPEPLGKALRLLRARGHETLLFHIMAREELNFDFDRWSRFECLEVDGNRIDLEPAEVRDIYLGEIRTFLKQLKRLCGEANCEYVPVTTDESPGDALARCLRSRTQKTR